MSSRRRFITGAAAAAAFGPLARPIGQSLAQDATPDATPEATPVVPTDITALPLRKEGVLTIHVDQPVWEPWFYDNDPSNGRGFEAAVSYAIAERIGFTRDQVEWGYTPFVGSFAPGPKDFDFYIQEVSITEERKESVDFSDAYYNAPLVVIAKSDSPVLQAKSIADLKPYKFSVQISTVYHRYIDEVIQPDQEPLVFDTNSDSLAALDNGTVDANIQQLQIAIFNTEVQFEGLSIGKILPNTAGDLGLVFEKDSELVPYVNSALASLWDDGTIDALIAEWLPLPPGLETYAE